MRAPRHGKRRRVREASLSSEAQAASSPERAGYRQLATSLAGAGCATLEFVTTVGANNGGITLNAISATPML